MGNRAVISFATHDSAPAVYLHWNGGRASVEGFLRACKALRLEPSALAFHDVAKGFIGGSTYLETVGEADCDNWDNGWYVLNDEWAIIRRKFQRNPEEHDPEKTDAITIESIAAWHYWPN